MTKENLIISLTGAANGDVNTATIISRALTLTARHPEAVGDIEDALFEAIRVYAPRVDGLLDRTVVAGNGS